MPNLNAKRTTFCFRRVTLVGVGSWYVHHKPPKKLDKIVPLFEYEPDNVELGWCGLSFLVVDGIVDANFEWEMNYIFRRLWLGMAVLGYAEFSLSRYVYHELPKLVKIALFSFLFFPRNLDQKLWNWVGVDWAVVVLYAVVNVNFECKMNYFSEGCNWGCQFLIMPNFHYLDMCMMNQQIGQDCAIFRIWMRSCEIGQDCFMLRIWIRICEIGLCE